MVVTGNKYFNNNMNEWFIEGDGKENRSAKRAAGFYVHLTWNF
jgi:hypothetical protein